MLPWAPNIRYINFWRAEAWEHKPVGRIYYRMTLEDGRSLEVFKNRATGVGYAIISPPGSGNQAG